MIDQVQLVLFLGNRRLFTFSTAILWSRVSEHSLGTVKFLKTLKSAPPRASFSYERSIYHCQLKRMLLVVGMAIAHWLKPFTKSQRCSGSYDLQSHGYIFGIGQAWRNASALANSSVVRNSKKCCIKNTGAVIVARES